MRQTVKVLRAVAVLALVSACGRVAGDAGDSSTANEFSLVFTGNPNGGTNVGAFTNLAFSVDRQHASRAYAVPDREYAELPGLIKSYDFTECGPGSPELLERNITALTKGDLVEVDTVDLEVLPGRSLSASDLAGGVCYGYRVEGGAWKWKFAVQPFTYDTASDRWRAHLAGPEGPLDAIKLVFGRNVPSMALARVTYRAR
ncbi:MAG: hypothetical protein QOI41_1252 [Myxococcales bacterium]|jgi:hypothetical protein|nr:hypothetical protein [Myxococcales bacterium]